MQGIWLAERRLSLRQDLAEPKPAVGECLVRVRRAGICNTDLELVRGYYPYAGVPGHEFVGEVVRGPEALAGRRVVGEINASCGACAACRAGRARHCPQRTVLGIVGRHGAFAEYLVLPGANLHVVPETVSDDAATFVEPLAASLQVQQQVRVRPADRVLVAGDGKLGQLIGQTLSLTGCELLVVGRHPRKLELLARRGVATATEPDLDAAGFDLVVECTGGAAGFELARRALRPGGTLVMKSTYADRLSLDASGLVVDEITVVGSRCGPFAPALRLLAAGRVDVESLIEAHYPLARGVEAMARAAARGALKVLLDVAAA